MLSLMPINSVKTLKATGCWFVNTSLKPQGCEHHSQIVAIYTQALAGCKLKPSVNCENWSYVCVCILLCTTVRHNTAKNSSDSVHSYPPDIHHRSDVVCWKRHRNLITTIITITIILCSTVLWQMHILNFKNGSNYQSDTVTCNSTRPQLLSQWLVTYEPDMWFQLCNTQLRMDDLVRGEQWMDEWPACMTSLHC